MQSGNPEASRAPKLTRRGLLTKSLRSAFGLIFLAVLGTPLVLGASGCAARDEQAKRIGALVGLEVERGAVRSDGEGASGVGVFEVTFADEQASEVETQITTSPSWHAMPLADALGATLYGPTGTALAAPGDTQDGFARITQGWWYFENRATDSSGEAVLTDPASPTHEQSNQVDPEEAAITQAFADAATDGLHLTIGLYDSQAHALFVYTLDSGH